MSEIFTSGTSNRSWFIVNLCQLLVVSLVHTCEKLNVISHSSVREREREWNPHHNSQIPSALCWIMRIKWRSFEINFLISSWDSNSLIVRALNIGLRDFSLHYKSFNESRNPSSPILTAKRRNSMKQSKDYLAPRICESSLESFSVWAFGSGLITEISRISLKEHEKLYPFVLQRIHMLCEKFCRWNLNWKISISLVIYHTQFV